MDTRLAQFVHGLYFDIQTIEGVQPLEVWNGIRELFDPYEKTSLVKNLYKIAMPLVNTRCYGRPFELHSRRAKETVDAVEGEHRQNEVVECQQSRRPREACHPRPDPAAAVAASPGHWSRRRRCSRSMTSRYRR